MIKDEFLHEVYKETGFMLPDERREATAYFRSKFYGRHDEEKVCEELGAPAEAVRNYLGSNESQKRSLPMRIAATAAFTAALPIIIQAAAVVAGIVLFVLVIFAVLMAVLPFVGIGLWLGGIGDVMRNILADLSAADRLCQIGMGLISSGLGIFILLLVVKIYKSFLPWLVYEISSSYRRLKRKLKRRRA